MNSLDTIGQMSVQCGSMNSSTTTLPWKAARACLPLLVGQGEAGRPGRGNWGEGHQVGQAGRDAGRNARWPQEPILCRGLAMAEDQIGRRGHYRRQQHCHGDDHRRGTGHTAATGLPPGTGGRFAGLAWRCVLRGHDAHAGAPAVTPGVLRGLTVSASSCTSFNSFVTCRGSRVLRSAKLSSCPPRQPGFVTVPGRWLCGYLGLPLGGWSPVGLLIGLSGLRWEPGCGAGRGPGGTAPGAPGRLSQVCALGLIARPGSPGGRYRMRLALLSDAAHMLTDAGAIILALAAMRLAARPARGATPTASSALRSSPPRPTA